MGLWVDGVCGLMVFVGFVDAIVLLDLWFLLIPLFCWVCGFWLWSMVTGFLRFVGSMVRLFFFLFLLFVFLRKSFFFNFFFFFLEFEKGKRETFKERDKREERCNGRYKPFEDKDWDGQFLNVMDLIGISSNLRVGLWNLPYLFSNHFYVTKTKNRWQTTTKNADHQNHFMKHFMKCLQYKLIYQWTASLRLGRVPLVVRPRSPTPMRGTVGLVWFSLS